MSGEHLRTVPLFFYFHLPSTSGAVYRSNADSSCFPVLACVKQVQPWMKLPAFYLLDAISKNIFDPYARQFTPLVVRLFLDTYEVVDQNTRSKMEEMLLTWRTGAPNGRELFGVVPQLAIERRIWGSDSTQNGAVRRRVFRPSSRPNILVQSSSSRQPGGQPSVSQAQVLSELEFVLGQKERALQANPYDKASQQHVSVLHQVRAPSVFISILPFGY